MPTYHYFCGSCEHEFDLYRKIDDRDAPTTEPCPSCEKLTIQKGLSAPKTVSGDGSFNSKVPDFFKDRMREIKKMSGKGCTIDV